LGVGGDRQPVADPLGAVGAGKGVAAGIWACAAQHAGQVMAVISLEIRRASMLKVLQLG
jgi:hypothetical protein